VHVFGFAPPPVFFFAVDRAGWAISGRSNGGSSSAGRLPGNAGSVK
jgi:hypothetical protein